MRLDESFHMRYAMPQNTLLVTSYDHFCVRTPFGGCHVVTLPTFQLENSNVRKSPKLWNSPASICYDLRPCVMTQAASQLAGRLSSRPAGQLAGRPAGCASQPAGRPADWPASQLAGWPAGQPEMCFSLGFRKHSGRFPEAAPEGPSA